MGNRKGAAPGSEGHRDGRSWEELHLLGGTLLTTPSAAFSPCGALLFP